MFLLLIRAFTLANPKYSFSSKAISVLNVSSIDIYSAESRRVEGDHEGEDNKEEPVEASKYPRIY